MIQIQIDNGLGAKIFPHPLRKGGTGIETFWIRTEIGIRTRFRLKSSFNWGGIETEIKIFLMTIVGNKGLITLISRFKAFNKRVNQIDSIKIPEQKTVKKRKRSNHIFQFREFVAERENDTIVFYMSDMQHCLVPGKTWLFR